MSEAGSMDELELYVMKVMFSDSILYHTRSVS